MDAEAKKTALRMIPYGLYVLTCEADDGRISGATVNWVTQTSFEPPLVAVGVKADSAAHEIIRDCRSFALNVLGKGQQDLAFAFFKSVERDGDSIGGQPFTNGQSGSPILNEAAAFLDCQLVEMVEMGDHSLVLGQVIDAGVRSDVPGRADDVTLALRDLGEKTFYGG
jgi:flavin reductase (DIM6/NTAB) family NADH-FMN oxidoreductase RutF